MDLSVVIPAFNAAGTIDAQLEALSTQQTERTFEVIVVDNNSMDDTAAKARAWDQSINQLRVVSQIEPGAARSRNAGARLALAPVVAFCDADDVVDAGWIDGLSEAIKDADAVFGPLDVDLLNSAASRAWRTYAPSGLVLWKGFLPWGASANCAVRLEALWAVGGFDEGFPSAAGEDVALSWSLQLGGFKLAGAPSAHVQYRLRQDRSEAIHQAREYGRSEVVLHERFGQHGMPRRTVGEAVRAWAWLPKHIAMLRDSTVSSTIWRRTLAKNIGRLEGSLRYRHWYP